MKKLIGTIMLLVLSFSLIACQRQIPVDTVTKNTENVQETSPETVDELSGWKKLYMDMLIANKENFKMGINYIGLNDLNFDGVPELIVSDNAPSAACSLGIFYIKDNKVDFLCGYTILENFERTITDDIGYYSNFEDDWLTLRKNKNTGELKYIMNTHNGSDCESFGNVISFKLGKDGGFDVKNEFEYHIFYIPENDYEISKENYLVSGKEVSADEYEKLLKEFENEWIDTGVRTCAMAKEYSEYSNSVPLNLEQEDLINLFNSYEKEY